MPYFERQKVMIWAHTVECRQWQGDHPFWGIVVQSISHTESSQETWLGLQNQKPKCTKTINNRGLMLPSSSILLYHHILSLVVIVFNYHQKNPTWNSDATNWQKKKFIEAFRLCHNICDVIKVNVCSMCMND
jgi:hypothetical protein